MSSNKKPENKAKMNLKNIGKFFQGYRRKFSEAFGLLEDYKQEQVVWRGEQAKECLDAGACLYCGCHTPAKFYADEGCEDPNRKCYPDMMSKEVWDKYKEKHNITIKID